MMFYLAILLILLLSILGFSVWLYQLPKLYRQDNKTSFWVQLVIVTALLITIAWKLQVIPLSKSIYIKEQTELLTGQSFWSSKSYNFEEIGIRGEGYTIDIYHYDEKMQEYFLNPDSDFFTNYPLVFPNRTGWTKHSWKHTPVKATDTIALHLATPTYQQWKSEVIQKISFVRDLSMKEDSYYAYNTRGEGKVDFFLIVPQNKLIVMINHNT